MDFYGRDELLVDLDSLCGKNSPSLSEISGAISVGAGGNVSAALDQLVEAGLVSRDIGMNPETGDEIRERRYRLSDNYVRFYLKCIRPAAKTIDAGTFRYSRLARFEEWNAVKGFAFENLIVNHYGEPKTCS